MVSLRSILYWFRILLCCTDMYFYYFVEDQLDSRTIQLCFFCLYFVTGWWVRRYWHFFSSHQGHWFGPLEPWVHWRWNYYEWSQVDWYTCLFVSVNFNLLYNCNSCLVLAQFNFLSWVHASNKLGAVTFIEVSLSWLNWTLCGW